MYYIFSSFKKLTQLIVHYPLHIYVKEFKKMIEEIIEDKACLTKGKNFY